MDEEKKYYTASDLNEARTQGIIFGEFTMVTVYALCILIKKVMFGI